MLTAIEVKKAEIRAKDYKLYDAGGLYLLVKPNGAKYWRYKYRVDGKEKTLALGTLDDVSLADAREKHQEARKLVNAGVDPNKQKRSQKLQRQIAGERSFANIARKWHEAKLKDWDKKHGEKLWRSLELHLFPHIGDLPINEITPRAILDVIQKIEKEGNTDVSHRVLQRCSAVFQYAICADLVQYNPAADLKGALVTHKTTHLPAIEAKELPEFFKRLEAVSTSLLNKLAIKLLAHTFVRQCELRKAKWEEFDFEAKLWRVPAEHTKMRREHVVPLSPQVIDLLHQIHALTGTSDFLLPSQNRQKNPYMSEGTITMVLKKMGYKGKMVGHGFRALATTTLNEAEFDADVIERQMQHQEANKSRKPYHRAQYMEQRTVMMNWWSNYLENAESDGKVIFAKFGG